MRVKFTGVERKRARERDGSAVDSRVAKYKCHTRSDFDPGELIGDAMQHAEEAIGFECVTHQRSRIDSKWLKLSQQEKAKDLIEISSVQHASTNRCPSPTVCPRM